VAAPVSPDQARRVLVLANETLSSDELDAELQRIDSLGSAAYFVCVPASPVETGQAEKHSPLEVWDATARAAQERLDQTLSTLRARNVEVEGELGDWRPLRALADAVQSFSPDLIVIATRPLADSVWQRYEVVDRARSQYPVPVSHVVADSVAAPTEGAR
jgi:GABA permease